jgi:uncharacterized protein (TIGR03435 family)
LPSTSSTGGRGGGIGPAPGGERYVASNAALKSLITEAYRLKLDQIVGGPDWIDRDRFDVNAKAERPSSSQDLRIMLQNLLEDRFRVRFHYETKDLPAYGLVVDKDAPSLKASEDQNAGDLKFDQSMESYHHVKMKAQSVPMSYFAWRLGRILDRAVIDQTNLKGEYDFTLAFVEEVPPDVAERALMNGKPIDPRPSIFEAVKRQLGLRLEPRKGPVDIMVIDHAQIPSGN